MNKKDRKVTFALNEKDFEKLKAQAKSSYRTVSSELRMMIEKQLADE